MTTVYAVVFLDAARHPMTRAPIDPMMRRQVTSEAVHSLTAEWLRSRMGDLREGRTFECPSTQCEHDSVDECVIASLIAYADDKSHPPQEPHG